MPTGASAMREKEFRKLERNFKKEGRYKGREEEVAARIVNKQRSQYGETKSAQANKRNDAALDRSLPIDNYQVLTIPEIRSHLHALSRKNIEKIRAYEVTHKNRKGVIGALDTWLR